MVIFLKHFNFFLQFAILYKTEEKNRTVSLISPLPFHKKRFHCVGRLCVAKLMICSFKFLKRFANNRSEKKLFSFPTLDLYEFLFSVGPANA